MSPATEPWLEVSCSPHFPAWLREQGVSLACTTYQTGKLFFLGCRPDARLAVFERTFNRCMGLWADTAGQTLWLGLPELIATDLEDYERRAAWASRPMRSTSS